MLIAALELNVLAMKAVIVVPIFAPKINAAACLSFMVFFATRGTTNEVVTVLDRMAAVVRIPQPKDLYGFLNTNCCTRPCELNPIICDITFRKNKMEPRSKITDNAARR